MKPFFVLFVIVVVLSSYCVAKRIAVIGAGIGGSSFAYFLSKLDPGLEIQFFEQSYMIGGRLSLIEIDGLHYEAGGSIIHPKNAYMVQFAKDFNLTQQPDSSNNKRFCVFDSNRIVFQQSSNKLMTLFDLFYKYGLDPYYLEKEIDSFLLHFEKIYEFQSLKFNKTFSSIRKMLGDLSSVFLNETKHQFNTTFNKKGYHVKFLREIIDSIIKVNYGQDLSVPGFTGSVAVAGAHPDLWSIKTGNFRVAESLLKASKAVIDFGTRLTGIRKMNTGKFSLLLNRTRLNQHNWTNDHYDSVILAIPLYEVSQIQFDNFDVRHSFDHVPYYELFVTFVEGLLSNEFDHLSSILMCCRDDGILNSIGLSVPIESYRPINQSTITNIYKIFSKQSLRNIDLKRFFRKDFQIRHSLKWLAYPDYRNRTNLMDFSDFELSKGLYALNVVELAASAMEMSVIGAKNLALLVHSTTAAINEQSSKSNTVHTEF